MKNCVKESRFPASIFVTFLIVLLFMSGFHTGIIVLMNKLNWNDIVQTIIPILYWSFIAVGLTYYTRWRIQQTYDAPLIELAKATQQVANGDFSVYVSPVHTKDKSDYSDAFWNDCSGK